MTMTSRERVLAALHRQPTDRLPWAPLADPYFISSIHLQGYQTDIIQTLRDVIQCDIIERHVSCPVEYYNGVEVSEKTCNGVRRKTYETPVGSIYEERKKSGNTEYVSHHMVETVEDMKVFTYLCEHTDYRADIQGFLERERYIGEAGIASVDGNMSPIQNMLQFVAGVENTVYLQMDYPDEMDELLAAMHERNKRQYAVVAQYPTDVIFDYEDTSTTVMSRTMFEEYSLPAINDYAHIVQESGKIFITHMCGKLTGFLDLVGQGCQNGIDSVCPPNTGDLYPWDARRAWGNEKVLIGGIDPPSLVRMDVQQTLQTAWDVIQNVKDKKGFILSTGDAVPYGTPMENLKVISQLIRYLGPRSLLCDLDKEEVEAFMKQYHAACNGSKVPGI